MSLRVMAVACCFISAKDIMRYNSIVLPVSAACPWNWPSGVTRFQMVVSRIQKCRPDLAMRMPEKPST